MIQRICHLEKHHWEYLINENSEFEFVQLHMETLQLIEKQNSKASKT